MSILECQEGLRIQSKDEEIIYTITTTNWVSSPTTPTFVVYDEADETDVTSTVMPSTATAAADIITLPELKDLNKGHTYRVEVKWVVTTSLYECYFRVYCER